MKKKSNKNPKEYAILAEFDDPSSLLEACKNTKKEGYSKFDAHSPFPIHGMDKAMKLKDSKLGWLVSLGALSGFSCALLLQIWAMTKAYAFKISGKPFLSLEAFIPVTFELTILFSAFTVTFGMIFLNKLPKWYNPFFKHPRFPLVSSINFLLVFYQ